MNLLASTKKNLFYAKEIALRIESDILLNRFDATLVKYKIRNGTNTNQNTSPKGLAEHFKEWVSNYRNKDCEKHIDYFAVHRMMIRWNKFDVSDILSLFNKEPISETTYNRRLQMLRTFFTWSTKRKITDSNPFEEVLKIKVIHKKKPERKPFSEDEIRRILTAFKNDTFNPPSSKFKHSFYYPFIYFIFKFGVRNAEAIGLRVKNVKIAERLVTINEVMARGLTCSNAASRWKRRLN